MKVRSVSLHVAAAALAIFVTATASATPITFHIKTEGMTPVVGQRVIVYLPAPFTLLDSQVTDAAGDVTVDDTAGFNQSRCFRIDKPGWKFVGGSAVPSDHDIGGLSNPFCPSDATVTVYHFWARRIMGSEPTVIGGVRGYVNPDLNESATVMVYSERPSGQVTMKVYTSRGKHVATVTTFARNYIQNELKWNARNFEGQKVASGIYIAHVVGAGFDAKVKIAIARN